MEADAPAPPALTERLLGVLLFRAQAYRDIAQDPRAARAAGLIVAAVGLILGLAGGIVAAYDPLTAAVALAVTVAVELLAWLAVSWALAAICLRVFRVAGANRRDVQDQMLRAVGFAHLFRVLEAVPRLGLLGDALWIAAVIFAVRAVARIGKAQAAAAVLIVAAVALAARAIAGRVIYLGLAALLPVLADLFNRLIALLPFQ